MHMLIRLAYGSNLGSRLMVCLAGSVARHQEVPMSCAQSCLALWGESKYNTLNLLMDVGHELCRSCPKKKKFACTLSFNKGTFYSKVLR